MAFETTWSSEDLAKNLCDGLVASGQLKEKPAFIRTDREKILADIFIQLKLDGAKMDSFKDAGPLETLVRSGTQGQAWVDAVVSGLKKMLSVDVLAANLTLGMSEEAKDELAAAREKTQQIRERNEADGKGGGGKDRGGGGRGDEECFNCGGLGHMSRDCDQPRKPKGGGRDGGGGRGDDSCFNCGESGHMSRDCPEPRKPKGGGKGDRGGGGGGRRGDDSD